METSTRVSRNKYVLPMFTNSWRKVDRRQIFRSRYVPIAFSFFGQIKYICIELEIKILSSFLQFSSRYLDTVETINARFVSSVSVDGGPAYRISEKNEKGSERGSSNGIRPDRPCRRGSVHWSSSGCIIPHVCAARVSRANWRINISPPRGLSRAAPPREERAAVKVSRPPSWFHVTSRTAECAVLLVIHLVIPLVAGGLPRREWSLSDERASSFPAGWARVTANISPATCWRTRHALVSTRNDSERGNWVSSALSGSQIHQARPRPSSVRPPPRKGSSFLPAKGSIEKSLSLIAPSDRSNPRFRRDVCKNSEERIH